MPATKSSKIAIVGGGIAGIVTCKTLLQDGFTDVTVFEASESIGGVWSVGKTYPNLSSNSPRGNYSLTDDTLMDEDKKSVWIFAEEIRRNLIKYATENGVVSKIKVNKRVKDVSETSRGWNISFQDGSKFEADVVIVCTGLFSHPRMPSKIPGQSQFSGLACHSSDVAKPDHVQKILSSKNVVIVGFGKSALDLAEWLGTEFKNKNHPQPHLVFRKPHWFVPMSFFGDLNFMRRSGAPGPWWRDIWSPSTQTRSSNSMAREKQLGRKVSIEEAIQLGHKIPEGHVLLPTQPFITDANFGVASEHFFKYALEGTIGLQQGDIVGFEKNNVLVKGKTGTTTVPADVVIFATGFDFGFPFFSSDLKKKLGIPWERNAGGAPRFFRTSLPVAFRDSPHPILFNGMFNSSSCSINIDILSHWISDFLQGNLHKMNTLPSHQEMERQIDAFQALDKKWSDKVKISIFGRWIDFADDCLMDMNIETRRCHPDDWEKDFTALYDASKWKGLGQERRIRDAKAKL